MPRPIASARESLDTAGVNHFIRQQDGLMLEEGAGALRLNPPPSRPNLLKSTHLTRLPDSMNARRVCQSV